MNNNENPINRIVLKQKRITDLSRMVRYFLREQPELRNDDTMLQMACLRHKFPNAFKTSREDGQEYVAIWALRIIREDGIKRLRAVIQNQEGLYLPTDPAVRKARFINQEAWEKWLILERPPIQHWNDTH